MSRQFDEQINSVFEIDGEEYSFVEPENFEELMKAYEVRDAIQTYYYGLPHDDVNQDTWLAILEEQEGYIKEYLDSLGQFDNQKLIDNISYLTKKNDLKYGDLESAVGVSPGYISRTAKHRGEDASKKRMSIDVVWKLAKIFEIDIKDLIEKDVSAPERGTALLKKFIEKLIRQTLGGKIDWISGGGFCAELDHKYVDLGLIKEQDEGAIYQPDYLNKEITWLLTDDICVYENFSEGKDLTIFSFANDGNENCRVFDILLICNERHNEKWERVFCTADDVFAHLGDSVADLVDLIGSLEFEPKISIEHRNMIADYIREDKK